LELPSALSGVPTHEKTIEQHADEVGKLAGTAKPKSVPAPQYMLTSRNSAELIKVTANAFLSLKISFANSIAKLADLADADVTQVMDGVGSDRRIGRAFLNAGRGYGGGCFPKDVSGLIRSAEEYGADMEIMRAAVEVNSSMPHYVIEKAKAALGDPDGDNVFDGKKVAVLGLSFKAGTSDVRKSPAIVIANTLAEQGAEVRAYDPEAMDESREELDESVKLAGSVDEAVKDSDIIFVTTDWPEFLSLDLAKLATDSGAKVFVDCMNRFDSAKVAGAQLAYVGIGKH
jgi:UDPglucose 6-dehydrogenase